MIPEVLIQSVIISIASDDLTALNDWLGTTYIVSIQSVTLLPNDKIMILYT